jgi:DNA-binding response OmpR family regulator
MKRVLLVEPDRLLAQTYLHALKGADIPGWWEQNAQDAVTFIDTYKPSMIILELQLAGHNGVEFLYELRSHSDWHDVPVLLHTIVPESDLGLSNEICRQLGVVGYCYKPQTSLQELIQEVRAITKKVTA